jgi:hypothetical protein
MSRRSGRIAASLHSVAMSDPEYPSVFVARGSRTESLGSATSRERNRPTRDGGARVAVGQTDRHALLETTKQRRI